MFSLTQKSKPLAEQERVVIQNQYGSGWTEILPSRPMLTAEEREAAIKADRIPFSGVVKEFFGGDETVAKIALDRYGFSAAKLSEGYSDFGVWHPPTFSRERIAERVGELLRVADAMCQSGR